MHDGFTLLKRPQGSTAFAKAASVIIDLRISHYRVDHVQSPDIPVHCMYMYVSIQITWRSMSLYHELGLKLPDRPSAGGCSPGTRLVYLMPLDQLLDFLSEVFVLFSFSFNIACKYLHLAPLCSHPLSYALLTLPQAPWSMTLRCHQELI